MATWQWQGTNRVQIRLSDDGTWFEVRFNQALFPHYDESDELEWSKSFSQISDLLREEAKKLAKEMGCNWESAYDKTEIEEF